MGKKFLLVLLLSGLFICANSQVKGPERIIGTYSGEQKKDLAQGNGKSVGKDTFEGEFKKGFPSEGTYTFGQDTTILKFNFSKGDQYQGEFKSGLFDGKGKVTFADKSRKDVEGYWDKGKYIGRTKLGYEVLKKNNIARVVVQKSGTAPNKIKISGLSDIIEAGSNNIEFNSMDGVYTDLADSKFPFIVNVKGTVPSNGSKADLQVLIENPGNWTITVYTD